MIETMQPGGCAAQQQLERILASPGFAQNERMSRFLRFLVEGQLAGREIELKESVIGVEVFERRPDYNPKRDAIVRTEAGRLRSRLAEYYANGGKEDALVIKLPKGGYVPVFGRADTQRPDPPANSERLPRTIIVGLASLVIALAIALALHWTWPRGLTITTSARTVERPAYYAANAYDRGGMNSLRLRHYNTSRAFDLYLQARTAYHPAREIPDSNVSVYQNAISQDVAFAPAYASLALAYAFGSSMPIGERNDSLVRMRAAAEQAVQLDPLLPEAHDAMGVVYARLGLWDKSAQSFKSAIRLDPAAAFARIDFSMNLLVPLGWISDALQQMRTAAKSDPTSPDVQNAYAYVLISAGQFDEAEEHCRRSVDPDECLGRVRIGQGRMNEAIRLLTAAPNIRYLGYAFGRAGRRQEAERLAAISPGALQQVLIYAGLGDKNRALKALGRMAELGPVRVGRTLRLPELALLRGDPRVRDLRHNVGLPD
jgi:tetratricopeptide (TPR) repeat protein